MVFVPHRLIEQGEMSRAMCRGHREEVVVSERKDLRIDRIAHGIQPWSRDVGIVPHLLVSTSIRKQFFECYVIPEIGMKQDHWHGFEIAPARSTTQTHHELGEFVST